MIRDKKFYQKFFAISVLLCLISMIGSYLFRINFGKTEVKDFTIMDAKGNRVAATMFKPKTATVDHPAPAVVSLHGSYNGRESYNYLSLELARRGYVAITIDCDGHGDSDTSKENPMDAFFLVTATPGSNFDKIETAPTSGMGDMVDYIYDQLNFVDKTQIGITGHSLGAKTANAVFAYNKIQELKGGVNKVSAVFLIGNQQLSINKKWQPYLTYDPDDKPDSGDEQKLYYDLHYGVSAARADENNYTTEAGGPWNFHKSDNARTFINELDNYHIAAPDSIEPGKYYQGPVNGSAEEYKRVIYQTNEIHTLNPYSPASNRNAVDFFQNTFTAPNFIDANNLFLVYEQAFSLLGLIGFFMAIYSFCCLLLNGKYFGSLVVKSKDEVFMPDRPNTPYRKFLYWLFMIGGSLVPTLYMMPLAMWVGGHKGVTFAQRSLFGTIIWPQGLQLEQALWAASAGLWTFLLFFSRYFLATKKQGQNASDWNYQISAKNLAKTILLSVLSVAAGYGIVWFANFFFNSNFSLLNYVVRFPNKSMILIILRYLPLFGLFYFANAWTQNIGRMLNDRKEWVNTLLMCIINVFGLLGVWIFQYYVFSKVGKVPLNSARVMQTWNFFIVQCLCTVIARRIYLKTGKIYLGAAINTLMFTTIACSHTMTLLCHNWWF